ncbi:hypothetical protein MUN77_00870 [Leucobacter allii]|uniref:hypothetical protein n=1 Tax=Leucobacter allii TaxID=2932247 RepID=UPI001FD35923|nr:hypothetical protein [Leucobacter allii]UOR01911.1 hypothetical protein MUN77_00870 [Leucobacter allii]
MTADSRKDWQVPHLAALDPEALTALFTTLDAPAVGEMSGEYAGFDYLGQSEETFAAGLARIQAGAGRFWLGKGFPGVEGDGASGYNRLLGRDGTVARRDRFGVHRGTSPIDGKTSLILKYSDFDNDAGSIGFLDEIRKVNDRLFLCTGTPDEGTGTPGFFFLAGPPAPFLGVDDPAGELRTTAAA